MASIADRVRCSEELIALYPRERELRKGGSVELRLMSVRDEVQFLQFARALPWTNCCSSSATSQTTRSLRSGSGRCAGDRG